VLEIKNVGNFKIRLNFKDPVAMMLFAELKDPVKGSCQGRWCQALVIFLLEGRPTQISNKQSLTLPSLA
jgi:hypothetical protein